MKTNLWKLAACALVLALPACSETTGTDEDENELTAEESEAIVTAAFYAVFEAMSSVEFLRSADADPNLASSLQPSFNATSSCEAGGNVRVSGNYNDNISQSGNGSYNWNMNATLNGCGVYAGARMVTLGGGFTVTSTWQLSNWNWVGDLVTTMSGAINWNGGGGAGGAGVCPINVTYRMNPNSGQVKASGTSCGQPVSL